MKCDSEAFTQQLWKWVHIPWDPCPAAQQWCDDDDDDAVQSAAASAAAAADVLRAAFALLPAALFSHRMTYFSLSLCICLVPLSVSEAEDNKHFTDGDGADGGTQAQAQWGRQLQWNRRATLCGQRETGDCFSLCFNLN